ncbi:MAG: hypothetical protein PW735_03910 [Acidobacteriaceae bacterium]|nr:hypothetical protein [Acidobacteriaceae bacterium]
MQFTKFLLPERVFSASSTSLQEEIRIPTATSVGGTMQHTRHTRTATPALLASALFLAPLVVTVPAHARPTPQQDQSPADRPSRTNFPHMQRAEGEVTAIDGKTLSLKAQDGTTSLVLTTADTRIVRGMGMGPSGPRPGGSGAEQDHHSMGNLQTLAFTDIQSGDGVLALGQLDDSTHALSARVLVVTDAATLKTLRENLGKTYITGHVTAVDLDNASLTVKRPDGVSQTIGFDETTSFRRAHMHQFNSGSPSSASAQPEPSSESITLADIKPGDNVNGKGSLKNGVFVPSELVVAPPHPLPPNQQPPATDSK